MSINKIINFKENVPLSVKNALSKIGNNNIISARLGRTPVQAVIQGALKVVASVSYDDLFHLFIELTLDNGQKWVLEKIERINLVKDDRSKKQGAEFTSSFSVNKTMNELFQNTKNRMGDKFLPYQSASNNCQYFILGVLDGNGFNNSERALFVKQDTKSIFANNPVLRKFANTMTDIGGYGNATLQEISKPINKLEEAMSKPINKIEEALKPKVIKKKLKKTMDKINFLN